MEFQPNELEILVMSGDVLTLERDLERARRAVETANTIGDPYPMVAELRSRCLECWYALKEAIKPIASENINEIFVC